MDQDNQRLQEVGFVHFGIAEVTLIVRDGNDLTTKREGGEEKKGKKMREDWLAQG